MIGFGVPAGAYTPMKFGATRSGTPCSIAVGRSGAAARRVPFVTASTRSFSARWRSSTWLAMAGGPIGQLARIGVGIGDQLFQIVRRHGGMDRDGKGGDCYARYRFQVLE